MSALFASGAGWLRQNWGCLSTRLMLPMSKIPFAKSGPAGISPARFCVPEIPAQAANLLSKTENEPEK